MATDDEITAEVAKLRAEKAELLAEKQRTDLIKTQNELAAETARAQGLVAAEADRKAIALVAEREQLAAEVESLRAQRATALAAEVVDKAKDLAAEVVVDASHVEKLRADRADATTEEAMRVASAAVAAATAEAAHTAHQDQRLDGINGSQARTAALLVIVQENLATIQKGIDEAAAVTKALSEKGVTSRQLQMGIAALAIPIIILIISLLVSGGSG